MVNVILNDADQSTTVTAGDTVAVIVAENPTAGFQWTLERLTGPMTLASSAFEAPAAAKPGAGGRRTFVLHADGPGSAELRLRYGRAWEDSRAQTRTLTVTIV
jgi:inhibitor of cysteine peptidase